MLGVKWYPPHNANVPDTAFGSVLMAGDQGIEFSNLTIRLPVNDVMRMEATVFPNFTEIEYIEGVLSHVIIDGTRYKLVPDELTNDG